MDLRGDAEPTRSAATLPEHSVAIALPAFPEIR